MLSLHISILTCRLALCSYEDLLAFLDKMKPVLDESWQEVDGRSRQEIDLEEAEETRLSTVTNDSMSEGEKLQEFIRLGEECRINKEYIMALSHFTTALDGYVTMRGPQHEDSVITAMAVALVLQNLDRESEAKDMYLKSVAPMVKPLFEECRKSGEEEKAEIIMLRDFETCRAVFGEDHHDTIACYLHLGVLYDEQFNDYEKALKYYERGQQGQKKTVGLTNPATATTTLNMAVMNQLVGNFEEVRQQLRYHRCQTLTRFGGRVQLHPRPQLRGRGRTRSQEEQPRYWKQQSDGTTADSFERTAEAQGADEALPTLAGGRRHCRVYQPEGPSQKRAKAGQGEEALKGGGKGSRASSGEDDKAQTQEGGAQ